VVGAGGRGRARKPAAPLHIHSGCRSRQPASGWRNPAVDLGRQHYVTFFRAARDNAFPFRSTKSRPNYSVKRSSLAGQSQRPGIRPHGPPLWFPAAMTGRSFASPQGRGGSGSKAGIATGWRSNPNEGIYTLAIAAGRFLKSARARDFCFATMGAISRGLSPGVRIPVASCTSQPTTFQSSTGIPHHARRRSERFFSRVRDGRRESLWIATESWDVAASYGGRRAIVPLRSKVKLRWFSQRSGNCGHGRCSFRPRDGWLRRNSLFINARCDVRGLPLMG